MIYVLIPFSSQPNTWIEQHGGNKWIEAGSPDRSITGNKDQDLRAVKDDTIWAIDGPGISNLQNFKAGTVFHIEASFVQEVELVWLGASGAHDAELPISPTFEWHSIMTIKVTKSGLTRQGRNEVKTGAITIGATPTYLA